LFPAFDSGEDAVGICGPDEKFWFGIGFQDEEWERSAKVSRTRNMLQVPLVATAANKELFIEQLAAGIAPG
jgi:hypothetical protein